MKKPTANITDVHEEPAKKKKRKTGSRLKKADDVNENNTHLARLTPIPAEASIDPGKWADEYMETLKPTAVKELEWALKFGAAKERLQIALELMAPKQKAGNNVTVVPAVQLILGSNNQLPWSQTSPSTQSQLVEGEVVSSGEAIKKDKE